MQDTFNLGWKLASVLDGRCAPELLRTYATERHAIAQGLIDFDKEWSKIMASPPKDPDRPGLGVASILPGCRVMAHASLRATLPAMDKW